MEAPETQTSPVLLLLLDQISLFVKQFLLEGEKVLDYCDQQPVFQKIKTILEQLTIEDIGITTKTIGYFFQPHKICGIKVLEEPFGSISVFCLSKDM